MIYVDGDATGLADGLTWSTAYTNVQDALTSALPGDEIWVAEGVYTPTYRTDAGDARTATFVLTNSVTLYGGFAATETLRTQRDWETHVTVLSGDLDGNDITDANGVVTDTYNIIGGNAYHVVTSSGVTTTAVLDGFTITAGKADGSYPHHYGGGMSNRNSNPQLINATFSGNYATDGGGMYNIDSSPTLTNVTFGSNTASFGGGIYNDDSSGPTLVNCILWGNSDNGGTDQSAQIHITDASPITVTYSLVQGGSIPAPATSTPTRSSCAIPIPATGIGPPWPTTTMAISHYNPHPPPSTRGTTQPSPPTRPTGIGMGTSLSQSLSTWTGSHAS